MARPQTAAPVILRPAVKIIIALDKFKGSLAAAPACEIVREALLSVHPEWEVLIKPMADGGDGTAEALHSARDGEWISLRVTGPLPATTMNARYLWMDRDRTAVVEMASASGLLLLEQPDRNPSRTTTYGTGELIHDAIGRGAKKILLGVGGSATVDGGVGAAMALGWQFLDVQGKSIGFGGGELERIVNIVPPRGCPSERSEESQLFGESAKTTETLRLAQGDNIRVEVLCDVDNPLCGPHGAARVFGPQKGATPEMVEQLDAGLRHLAELVKTQLGRDLAEAPGAGAAGGLAFGATAFLNAKLIPGIDAVADAVDLDGALRGADWVITGEGRFDEQSLRGKVVSGVAKRAAKLGVKVAVFAGSVTLVERKWRRHGIEMALATQPGEMPLDQAMANAGQLLAERTRELAKLL